MTVRQNQRQNQAPRNVIDATPLAQPVNPFAFGVEMMKLVLRQPGLPAEAVTEIRRRAAWLKKLESRIDTGHTSPILLTAVVQGALSREERDWLLATLQAVREEVRAAQGLEPEPAPQPEPEPEIEIDEDYGDAPPPGV